MTGTGRDIMVGDGPTAPAPVRGRVGLALLALFALTALLGPGIRPLVADGSAEPDPFTADTLAERQQDDALLAFARAHWSSLTPAERDAIRARYEEYRELGPEEQRRALRNFDRLLEIRNRSAATTDPLAALPSWAFHQSLPEDLESRIVRMARDPVYRERLRQLDERFGELLRQDRALLLELQSLPRHERGKRLWELHERWELARLDSALAIIGATPEQSERVRELDQSREEQEREIFRQMGERMSEISETTSQRIAEILGLEGQDADAVKAATQRILAYSRGYHGRHHHRHRQPTPPPSPELKRRMEAGQKMMGTVYGAMRAGLEEHDVELDGRTWFAVNRAMFSVLVRWFGFREDHPEGEPPVAEVLESVRSLVKAMNIRDEAARESMEARLAAALTTAIVEIPADLPPAEPGSPFYRGDDGDDGDDGDSDSGDNEADRRDDAGAEPGGSTGGRGTGSEARRAASPTPDRDASAAGTGSQPSSAPAADR